MCDLGLSYIYVSKGILVHNHMRWLLLIISFFLGAQCTIVVDMDLGFPQINTIVDDNNNIIDWQNTDMVSIYDLTVLNESTDVDTASCPTGMYCVDANTQLLCPPGTYQPIMGASTYDQCLMCPTDTLTTICPAAGLSQPVDCLNPAEALPYYAHTCNIFGVYLTNQSAVFCPAGSYVTPWDTSCYPCPPGSYCFNFMKHACPIGTANTRTGSYLSSDCETCPPGTHTTAGHTQQCWPCPMNHVCENSTVSVPCPTHTTAPEGSSSMLNCVCLAGYECEYTKEITLHIAFNSTEQSLSMIQSSPALLGQLLDQVAAACGVDASLVTLVSLKNNV